MTGENSIPTLPQMQEQFLGTIQAPRTAATYRWALGALQRFIEDTGYIGYCLEDDNDTLPFPNQGACDGGVGGTTNGEYEVVCQIKSKSLAPG